MCRGSSRKVGVPRCSPGIKDPWLVYVSVSDGREERRRTVWSSRPTAASYRRCHIDSRYRTENIGSHLSHSRILEPALSRVKRKTEFRGGSERGEARAKLAHISDAGEKVPRIIQKKRVCKRGRSQPSFSSPGRLEEWRERVRTSERAV